MRNIFKFLMIAALMTAWLTPTYAANTTLPLLGAGTTIAGGDLFISRQGSDTVDKQVTATQVKTFTTTTANNLSSYSAGTAYTLTATPATVTFGTTTPSVTLNAAGTYLILMNATVDFAAATFAANRAVTLVGERTNNTPGDLTNCTAVMGTNVVTTTTGTMQNASFACIYSTLVTTDVIKMFGSVAVIPTVGALNVSAASIVAYRLQQ